MTKDSIIFVIKYSDGSFSGILFDFTGPMCLLYIFVYPDFWYRCPYHGRFDLNIPWFLKVNSSVSDPDPMDP